MFAILLETGSETGIRRARRQDARGNSSPALAVVIGRPRASPSFLLAPPLLGFAHLGSNSSNKEWRFLGGQKGLSSMIAI
jgi:hypothetical protein